MSRTGESGVSAGTDDDRLAIDLRCQPAQGCEGSDWEPGRALIEFMQSF